MVVLQTSRSEPMILCVVNQPMLLPWATLLKINLYSVVMKKSNNLITHFRLKLNVRKVNTLRKKVLFVSFPLATEIIAFGWQFYFRWQVLNALFIYREKSFFSYHVYTCCRWERKYCDIVSCDVCDGLIGNRSESTKLPFETQVIVDEHRD